MGSDFPIRLLCLTVVILGSSLVAVIAGLVSWSIEPGIGRAIVAGSAAFAGSAPLFFGAINYLMKREA
ncbi:hypothetical protein [Micromonospora sp. NPDC005197]|uniref:hypothetical protein n=1 Tax=Micromonospora sp. NPDC005197 TaxID=3157020 RepID=UPI0033A37351